MERENVDDNDPGRELTVTQEAGLAISIVSNCPGHDTVGEDGEEDGIELTDGAIVS